MKYLITFATFLLLAAPISTRADEVVLPIDTSRYTLENQSRYAVAITVDDVPLTNQSTSTIVTGKSHTFSYSISPSPYWAPGLTKEDIDTEFADSIATNVTYLELWKGTIFGPDATFIQAWDTNATTTGTITTSVPTDGPYFFLINTPNTIARNPLPVCDEIIIENCTYGETLLAGTMEEERKSFMPIVGTGSVFHNTWGFIHKFTLGIGAVRFAVGSTALREYSNVLFLPGITGSRLYENVKGKEKRHWELNFLSSQSDARALYLDVNGRSTHPIYTKANGAISHTDIPLIGFNVYKTFFEQLDSLKSSGRIHDFGIFPYDWRISPTDVAEQGTRYDTGTKSLTDVITELASTSPTGKVTLVGHSNGGLIAKAIVSKLAREGKANLIDSVMLLDTPQLGTPDTLASMLHGDFGALTGIGGVFLSQPNAKGLMENMPSAYDLLPSTEYFSKVIDPIIDLSSAPFLRAASGVRSSIISNSNDFAKFVTATKLRPKPSAKDVLTPNTLSPFLFARSVANHADMDTWVAPPGVRVMQIAGWGLETTKAIHYAEKSVVKCSFIFTCKSITKVRRELSTVIDGDNTVVIPSQIAMPQVATYYLNLFNSNQVRQETHGHADITEMNAFQQLFPLLLGTTTPKVLPEYVTQTIPEQDAHRQGMRIHISGPASMVATDTQGRQAGSHESPNSEISVVTNHIPNSSYKQVGDDTYFSITNGSPVTVLIQANIAATTTDTVTIQIATSTGNVQSTPSTYGDIPVTASTTATVILTPGATTTPPVFVDTNGNGSTTIQIQPQVVNTDAINYLDTIIRAIPTLYLNASNTEQLVSKFTNAKSILETVPIGDLIDDDKNLQTYGTLATSTNSASSTRIKINEIQQWITTNIYLAKPLGVSTLHDPSFLLNTLYLSQTKFLYYVIDHLRSLL